MNLTSKALLDKAKRPSFSLGSYLIVSQKPDVITPGDRLASVEKYLPAFISVWQAIEEATGHKWKNTSYIRDSPSHRLGQAFDLAPDIAPSSEKHYAVYKKSDPVLYKRQTLIEQLRSTCELDFPGSDEFSIGIFIEPDHLHLQALQKGGGEKYPVSTITWPVPKPVYGDTYERMKLPLLP